MSRIVRRAGITCFGGQSYRTFLFFDRLWVHVNRCFAWPLVSFKELPF